MKKYLLTIAVSLFFLGNNLFCQITTIPEYPSDQDLITLTFDATGTALENYTGEVYAHTGVILEGSPDWTHVIGDWGNNTNQPHLTSLGNHKYQLSITPNIRGFYSVSAGEVVAQMAFVFRSADGSAQTRPDLFVDVYGSELSINITQPTQKTLVAPENSQIPVAAASPRADSMFLYINNEQILAVKDISINYTINATNIAGYWTKIPVVISAKNTTGMVSDTFTYTVIPVPQVQALPSGIEDGINYINDSTAVLCLYAPNKNYVFAIGDFNNWEADSAYYMNITPDGKRFWVQLNHLVPAREYIFQYWVDGSIKIGDPYADKVSDPWNDSYIDATTYPNMLSYPSDKTSGIATVLQTAQQPYSWQTTNFTPPAKTDLVIYELLMRDFTALHSYQSLIDTLGYLQRLGVNAIELMPVSEFEGNLSWGYNPNYYFAPDKYYGTKNALKHFIDECHSRGIAVIQDMVLNHSFGTSPMVMLYWDALNNRPAANNPWFNPIAKHDFNVGYDFNHESEATKYLVNRVVKYWINEYHVDGYRFDLSKGFTQTNTLGNTTAWGHYDQSRINIWQRISDSIWSVKPNAYVILEHFADNDEETVLSNMGMMLWGNANYNYGQASMGWSTDWDFTWGSYKARNWQQPNLVTYMESHDEEREMYRNITNGNVHGDYNIKDTTTALQRMELSGLFFFTIPGPKMIWQFGELGYDYSINWPSGQSSDRLTPKPARWDYNQDYRRHYLNNFWSALINLKKTQPVFETTDFTLSLASAGKVIHLNDASMNATILGNFGVVPTDVVPNFQSIGKWYDYFSGDSITVNYTNSVINLQPGEYHLYTDKKLAKPELNTGIPEIVPGNGSALVYPNPSKDEFSISVNLSQPETVNLSIYSMFGQKLSVLFDGKSGSGIHTFSWDVSNVSKGIYFYRLQVGNSVETGKLIKN